MKKGGSLWCDVVILNGGRGGATDPWQCVCVSVFVYSHLVWDP